MNMMNNNMQEMLRKLQADPQAFFRQAGVNVPAELMNDPKQMVMHLINSGQVKNPMIGQFMRMMNTGR